jgi:hypothetical protein
VIKVGETIPNTSLVSSAGKPLTLEAYRGKRVLLLVLRGLW